ncbi:MAG: hypothetical protein ACOVT5_13925 [Armatimonadaceae bacterium]
MLAILLAASLAAPVPKAKEVELFYPTTVGTKRVVETKKGNMTFEFTETVDKVVEKDGVHTVSIKLNKEVFTYRVSPEGLACHAPLVDDPMPELKLEVKEGETWEHETKVKGQLVKKTTYTLGKREEVTVPAGRYQAVRVESETTVNGEVSKLTSWYAPDVGLVKTESGVGNSRVSQELKEFTPGK